MPKLLTPAIYWLLIALWSFILYIYLTRMRRGRGRSLVLTLIAILAIDAFRSLFESVYFGLWYTSVAGLLPSAFAETLTRPEWVILPKLFNVGAALTIIFLLLRRWLPQDERESKQSKLDLTESEQKFHAFTNQSVDGISVADMEGRYTYVNPSFCEMMGYSEQELLSMTVFDVKAPEQDHSSFDRSKKSEVGLPILVELQRKNGEIFTSEVLGTVIEYGDKKKVLGVVRDVTERENATKQRISLERQVQHAQKLESLGVLAGGIAHDFNNLLTSMLGNAQLILDQAPKGSSLREGIEEIEDASKRAAALTKQMLDYSGRGRFVVQDVDAHALVQGIAKLLAASIGKKIELRYDFADDTPLFRGDESQVSQIVMNLITNASEAIGDEAGTISLSTGKTSCTQEYLDSVHMDPKHPHGAGTYTFIEVQDSGCGMDEETLERVFDPFFTTKFTGRGLGMSAVLGIVRGHGGLLDVESAPGEGSTFKLLFPASEVHAAAQPLGAPPSKKIAAMSTGAKVVLLADDEESVRRVGKRLLEHLGYEVLTAKDGADALAVYRSERGRIACTLLDLTMPVMGGHEVLAAILELDPEAKVILCSGYGEQEAGEHATDLGARSFVQKPYERSDLEDALERTLRDGA